MILKQPLALAPAWHWLLMTLEASNGCSRSLFSPCVLLFRAERNRVRWSHASIASVRSFSPPQLSTLCVNMIMGLLGEPDACDAKAFLDARYATNDARKLTIRHPDELNVTEAAECNHIEIGAFAWARATTRPRRRPTRYPVRRVDLHLEIFGRRDGHVGLSVLLPA
jgi:hypothetical protein